MTTPLLEVRDLCVFYGKVEAVHHLSLTVDEGRIVTVIGPNGAGKTTSLNAIMGLIPSRGAIVYLGESVDRLSVEQRVARGLVLVPERRELFAGMSVADNLALGAFSQRRSGPAAVKATLQDVYRRFPRLAERRAQLAGTLSGGERQMLALARALMAEPQLLLLDEPSAGLSPIAVDLIFEKIAEINATGVAILMVEQNARRALAMSHRGYVLDNGQNRFEGLGPELLHDPKVVDLYLGGPGAEPADVDH